MRVQVFFRSGSGVDADAKPHSRTYTNVKDLVTVERTRVLELTRVADDADWAAEVIIPLEAVERIETSE
jgi:hypothetical protein